MLEVGKAESLRFRPYAVITSKRITIEWTRDRLKITIVAAVVQTQPIPAGTILYPVTTTQIKAPPPPPATATVAVKNSTQRNDTGGIVRVV